MGSHALGTSIGFLKYLGASTDSLNLTNMHLFTCLSTLIYLVKEVPEKTLIFLRGGKCLTLYGLD